VVSAYRTFGQQVEGELVIQSTATAALEVTVDAVTSDYRWDVALEQTTPSVPAGGRVAVPIRVTVPADTWADRNVRISARARDAAGRQVEAWQEISVAREAQSVARTLHWPMPPRLRGGFNAAWAPLGGALSVDRTETPTTDFLN